jgi:hypothetical protein
VQVQLGLNRRQDLVRFLCTIWQGPRRAKSASLGHTMACQVWIYCFVVCQMHDEQGLVLERSIHNTGCLFFLGLFQHLLVRGESMVGKFHADTDFGLSRQGPQRAAGRPALPDRSETLVKWRFRSMKNSCARPNLAVAG